MLKPPDKVIVGQKVAILNRKQQVLLLKRSLVASHPGEWDLPGGALDKGENPYDSIRREVREETKLIVFDLQPIHVYSYFQNKKDFVVSVYYKARTDTDSVKIRQIEHTDSVWVDKNSVTAYDLQQNYLDVIEKAYASEVTK